MRYPSLALALVTAPTVAAAQGSPADTTLHLTFGGFVDSYYAYDFGKPPTIDRSFAGGATFTTQPARHNEFNINLAYVEAVLSGNRVRGRLALQAGTSVQSNYGAEPTNGVISGPTLSRLLQEAYAGYLVTPSLWVDAGVFYSHMGMESWASKDNLTYTRSLTAEYSPYYSSGVRAIWSATPKLTAHLHIVNGWQNISETNSDKGVGLRLDFNPSSTLTLSYYNFFNGEVGGRLRVFNGAGVKLVPDSRTTLVAQFDIGSLGASNGGESSSWYGFTAIGRRALSSHVALVGRVERFDDEDQVNIVTGLSDPFRGNGLSFGVDVTPYSRFLWRTEWRGFSNADSVFPSADGGATPSSRNVMLVTSFALIY
jgi:putative OmpL-like beta-barrel porin-2